MSKGYAAMVLLGLVACFVTVTIMVAEQQMSFWTTVGAIMIPTGFTIAVLATKLIQRRRR